MTMFRPVASLVTPSFFVKLEKTLQDFKRGLFKQFSFHVQADMVQI